MTRRGLGTKHGKAARRAVEEHYTSKAAADHDRITAELREYADIDEVGHPPHTFDKSTWSVVFPDQPPGLRNMLVRWRARRACRAAGGHFWHPSGPIVPWRCCGCGAGSADGS